MRSRHGKEQFYFHFFFLLFTAFDYSSPGCRNSLQYVTFSGKHTCTHVTQSLAEFRGTNSYR